VIASDLGALVVPTMIEADFTDAEEVPAVLVAFTVNV